MGCEGGMVGLPRGLVAGLLIASVRWAASRSEADCPLDDEFPAGVGVFNFPVPLNGGAVAKPVIDRPGRSASTTPGRGTSRGPAVGAADGSPDAGRAGRAGR